jgi:hypothetical protein
LLKVVVAAGANQEMAEMEDLAVVRLTIRQSEQKHRLMLVEVSVLEIMAGLGRVVEGMEVVAAVVLELLGQVLTRPEMAEAVKLTILEVVF